jgi:phosphoglycolate phosphatase
MFGVRLLRWDGRPPPTGLMARLVFDLDGTLVDSAPTIVAAANALPGRVGPPAARPRHHCRLRRARHGPAGRPAARRIRRGARRAAPRPPGALPHPLCRRPARRHRGLSRRPGSARRPRRRRPWPCGLHPEAGRAGPGAARGAGAHAADHRADRRRQPRRAEARPAAARPCRGPAAGGPVVFVGDSETDAATAANAGVPFLLHLAVTGTARSMRSAGRRLRRLR